MLSNNVLAEHSAKQPEIIRTNSSFFTFLLRTSVMIVLSSMAEGKAQVADAYMKCTSTNQPPGCRGPLRADEAGCSEQAFCFRKLARTRSAKSPRPLK